LLIKMPGADGAGGWHLQSTTDHDLSVANAFDVLHVSFNASLQRCAAAPES
jgi:hypothetical protein